MAISCASVEGMGVGRGRELLLTADDVIIDPPAAAEDGAEFAAVAVDRVDGEDAPPRLVEGNFQVFASFE